MEADENQTRNSAGLMVASLAGSLAHVTCKVGEAFFCQLLAMFKKIRVFVNAVKTLYFLEIFCNMLLMLLMLLSFRSKLGISIALFTLVVGLVEPIFQPHLYLQMWLS